MKAVVDKETCIGCGLCESICPEIFKMDDDGKAVASDKDIGEDLKEGARDAEAQCPVGAIKVD